MSRTTVAALVLLTPLFTAAALPAQPARSADGPAEIPITELIGVPSVSRGGRAPVWTDAMQAKLMAGTWQRPKAGDALSVPNGPSRTWGVLKAGADGWFQGQALAGGYALAVVSSPEERVMVLDAAGHGMLYVNGEPRAGDPYGHGNLRLPVLLRKGENELLFNGGRGRLRAKLVAPQAEAELDLRDATLPDLVLDQKGEKRGTEWAAVPVLNATPQMAADLMLRAIPESGRATTTAIPALIPLSGRKVGFPIDARVSTKSGKPATELPVRLEVLRKGKVLHTVSIKLRVRPAGATYKQTFISDIDGSVQYYGVTPATPEAIPTPKALVLSLHGASVEAIGQAEAYSPKSWAHVVAATNRRPFGFDWEDWGRWDAMEVLADASKRLGSDPRRTYLTGHSMGGHGTWQVGVTFPDRFAAIGPSAGWISFFSYGGAWRPSATPTSIERMLARTLTPSDTLGLSRNYASQGVYVIHGDADDNVPVTQAREMAKRLGEFHRDWTLYEQPGAGHWWDASDEPGADCVDWQPLFELFSRRFLPAPDAVRHVDFSTASPGISAKAHWLRILQQQHPLEVSRGDIRWDPGTRRFRGTTQNIAFLALDAASVAPRGTAFSVELDGTKLEKLAATEGSLFLKRVGDRWAAVAAGPGAEEKRPEQNGPFKEAFRNRMLFVYGTRGSAAENAWALAKARFDAESFWYRGNGSVDVLPDSAFDAKKQADRSVILYGNRETNGAWDSLLSGSPVQVTRGTVRVGAKELKGENLASLFVRPRKDSRTALVAVVGGSGLAGMRLTDRTPYFISGAGYPDVTVMGTEMLEQGAGGVRMTGYFGPKWDLESGEWAWFTDELKLPSTGSTAVTKP